MWFCIVCDFHVSLDFNYDRQRHSDLGRKTEKDCERDYFHFATSLNSSTFGRGGLPSVVEVYGQLLLSECGFWPKKDGFPHSDSIASVHGR
jgi:hypothetical protein